jgi:hypothetical protein
MTAPDIETPSCGWQVATHPAALWDAFEMDGTTVEVCEMEREHPGPHVAYFDSYTEWKGAAIGRPHYQRVWFEFEAGLVRFVEACPFDFGGGPWDDGVCKAPHPAGEQGCSLRRGHWGRHHDTCNESGEPAWWLENGEAEQ